MNVSPQSLETPKYLPRPARPADPGPSLLVGRAPPSRRGILGWILGLAWILAGAFPSGAHQSPTGCSGSGLGIDLFSNFGDVHIGDTIRYSVRVFNSPFPACDATGIAASVVTPDGITHSITALLRRRELVPGDSDYYTNVVSYVVRAQDLRPDGTVRATAEDNGDIHQNDTNSRGGGNQGVNTEVNLPCVLITAVCVGSIGENGAITFSGTVTNCGNSTLVGLTVTNFVNNGSFAVLFPTNLAIGQSTRFSGSWIPANPCLPSTAVLTVRARDEFTATPQIITNLTTITCQNVLTTGIKVTKSCPILPATPGRPLTFSGSVSNTGNVTLNNIVVVNDRPAPNTVVFSLAALAPGESATFTGAYEAPANCSVSDTLTATATSRCGVGVTSSATATCVILTTPQIAVTAVCPVAPLVPGSLLSYSGTVRNTGDITLTNVVVMSDQPVANTAVFAVGVLAPGASLNFTHAFTAPAVACSVVTSFRGTGRDICTLVPTTNIVSATCSVITAPAVVATLVCPVAIASSGGPIVYTGTVRNSGNVALNNVFVVNNRPSPGTPVIGPITLAVGATVSFTTSFTAPLDTCSVTGTVNITANDACSGLAVSTSASATCPLLTLPALVLTQVCPVAPVVPGGLLTFTGSVRNSGNITLTNVVILNNLVGTVPVFAAVALAPGESAVFSGSYVSPTNCLSTSLSTATARSLCGLGVTNTATSTCTILTAPAISVTAACPVGVVLPGGILNYTGTVKNEGNITLTNVVVTSDQPSPNTSVFTVALLAPGASANFTRAFAAPADACTITTIFTGTGRDVCTLAAVTGAASTVCRVTTAPAIAVTLVCPAGTATAGAAITYDGTVRNTGNVTLNNVFVVNNRPSASSPVIGPITLAPGATVAFKTTFTSPLDVCSVSSTVIATGIDNCSGLAVSNSATATCPLATSAAVVITQTCPVGPTSAGAPFTFAGTIRNTGNITLTNLVVVNNLSGATPVLVLATLAPGASADFGGSYVTGPGCATTSTSTVTGRSICGVAVTHSASATCPLLTTPSILVTQTCPTTPVLQGGTLTYSGTVMNTGNITLTNVVVSSDHPTTNLVVFTWATLAPGATERFSGSYKVPTNCCVVSNTLRGRGQGCDGVLVTDTATRTCIVETLPRIVVTKICPTGELKAGDLLVYSGTVSNAGNITLINVSVSNNHSPNDPPLRGPITLAPGEWVDYTASYIIPENTCGTDTVTATGLDVCTFVPVTHAVVTTCPVTTPAPAIKVRKNCPLVPTLRGELFTFSGSVSNSGPVTLVNVYVTDNQPTNGTPVIGPITLAPGASVDFTGSYISSKCCCLAIDTLTARGQSVCTGSNAVDTATVACPLLTRPAIALVQECPASPILMGSLYRFSGYVTNTGDAVLTNVFVFGPQGASTVLLGPIELAPGESESYSGTYTVPFDTCSVEVTTSARDTCRGELFQGSTRCPVSISPSLALVETCPAGPVAVGSPVVFGGSVANTGNVTLINVQVFSSQTALGTLVLGPISLAPGASASFTGSYLSTGATSAPTNTVTVVGSVACEGRTVVAGANCRGPVPALAFPNVGTPTFLDGVLSVEIRTEAGLAQSVQYKNNLSDPEWITLENVSGTGGRLIIRDPSAAGHPARFYRVTSTPGSSQ